MRFASKSALSLSAVSLIALATFGVPTTAHADVTWTLSGVTFSDGGTASGTFVTDDNGLILSADITTTTTDFGTEIFDTASGASISGLPSYFYFTLENAADDDLYFEVPIGFFTTAWSPAALSGDLTDGVTTDDVVSADATAVPTPEPASVALFGAGLLGLMFARRRHA
jgi:PEP-CTERM motif